MTHLELALLDQRLTSSVQLEQAQQVADGRARTTDGVGGLLVRDVELADEPLQRARLFERVQVLALDVLDQRHRDGRIVRHAADDGRNVVQARDLRGAPATLAGDDFVALRLAGLLAPPAAARRSAG